MDAKHEIGESMEVTLSPNNLAVINSGRTVCETELQTGSGLIVFAVQESHPLVETAEAQFYGHQMGIYIPERMLGTHAVRLAEEFEKPIAVIEDDQISEMNESRTRKIDLFGESGRIIVKLAAQT